jgi:hypothetical protein
MIRIMRSITLCKHKELRIKLFKSIFIIVVFLSLVLSSHGLILTTYAQQATPSAESEAKETTSSGILTKIEDLKKEIASRAADLKSEIDKRTQNKALIGKANVITTDSMTLETKNGSKTIRLNEYTLYQNTSSQKTKKTFTKDDIKTDDQIVCLGDIDEKGIMTAKKVVKVDPILTKKRNFILGTINTNDSKSITLQLKDLSLKTLPIDPKLIVRNGKDEGILGDIKQGRKAIILTNDKDEVTFVYLSMMNGITKATTSQNEGTSAGQKRN